MKKHKEEFKTKREEQASETKAMQTKLENAQKIKQVTEEKYASLEQSETNTRQRNKNNNEREENLWFYKLFHDRVANKDWLASQPLEKKKKEWITKKYHEDNPDGDINTISEEEYNVYQEKFIKSIKENIIPIDNPEEAFQVYFKKPEELYEIFTSLEEQNLQLIQKNQGLLKEIEEKKINFNSKREAIEQEYNKLSKNEKELLEKNKEEEKRSNEERIIMESGEQEKIEAGLTNLKKKISKLYSEITKLDRKAMTDTSTEKLIDYLAVIEQKINEINSKVEQVTTTSKLKSLLEIQTKEMKDLKTAEENKKKIIEIEKKKEQNEKRDKDRALKKQYRIKNIINIVLGNLL